MFGVRSPIVRSSLAIVATIGAACGGEMSSEPAYLEIAGVAVHAPDGGGAFDLKVGDTVRLGTYTVITRGDSMRGILTSHSWIVRTPNVLQMVNDDFAAGKEVGTTWVILTSALNNDSVRVTVK